MKTVAVALVLLFAVADARRLRDARVTSTANVRASGFAFAEPLAIALGGGRNSAYARAIGNAKTDDGLALSFSQAYALTEKRTADARVDGTSTADNGEAVAIGIAAAEAVKHGDAKAHVKVDAVVKEKGDAGAASEVMTLTPKGKAASSAETTATTNVGTAATDAQVIALAERGHATAHADTTSEVKTKGTAYANTLVFAGAEHGKADASGVTTAKTEEGTAKSESLVIASVVSGHATANGEANAYAKEGDAHAKSVAVATAGAK